jgi:hypothetical protein
MKITKRQLRRIIKENTSFSPMKSRATPETRRLVSNSRRQEMMRDYSPVREAYPVSGEPSNAWITFEKAVEDAALPMIDAGMELDGVLQAMHDSIDNIFAEWEDEPAWDEADQDYAEQAYIEQYGDPYEDQ